MSQRRCILSLVLSMLICSAPACLAEEALELYVSPHGNDAWSGTLAEPTGSDGPLATLARARDVIRELKRAGSLQRSVNVYLRGGTYELAETLVLTPEDSGTPDQPITYQAYPGEIPILSGGRRITTSWVPRASGAAIQVTTIPEVARGEWYVNSLFVNGRRAVRARTPNEGSYYAIKSVQKDVSDHTAFAFNGADINPAWQYLNEVEIVAIQSWTQSRHRIQRVSGGVVELTGSPTQQPMKAGQRYFVENLYEGLTSPGEWYLNRHTGQLYYYPLPGDNLATAEIIVPRLQQLLRLEGRRDPALKLADIDFTIAAWVQLATPAVDEYPILTNRISGGQPGYTVQLLADHRVEAMVSDGVRDLRVTSNTVFAPNTWHHVAVTWDHAAKTLRLYVDGIAERSASDVLLGSLSNPQAYVQLGYRLGNSLAGALDDVGLMTRQLAADEILRLAAGTSMAEIPDRLAT